MIAKAPVGRVERSGKVVFPRNGDINGLSCVKRITTKHRHPRNLSHLEAQADLVESPVTKVSSIESILVFIMYLPAK